ncbi:Hypothetical_protein [Hexamita inflata]|uniref:Hypothetical_protein n=1 Tax=Hexamita inflata TaxID=28002 RepID=A0AA86TWM1_9EUKA|nr:Hypothetical protein HINF_LOCUS19590 [Hexamita inflata]
MLSIYNTSDLRKLTYHINITLVQRDTIKLGRQQHLSTFNQSLTMLFQSIIQTSIQMKQATHQIHTSRQIRTKPLLYSHLSWPSGDSNGIQNVQQNNSNKILAQQQNVQIAFNRKKLTPENCKQDVHNL